MTNRGICGSPGELPSHLSFQSVEKLDPESSQVLQHLGTLWLHGSEAFNEEIWRTTASGYSGPLHLHGNSKHKWMVELHGSCIIGASIFSLQQTFPRSRKFQSHFHLYWQFVSHRLLYPAKCLAESFMKQEHHRILSPLSKFSSHFL